MSAAKKRMQSDQNDSYGHEVVVELKFLNGCFGEINGDGS